MLQNMLLLVVCQGGALGTGSDQAAGKGHSTPAAAGPTPCRMGGPSCGAGRCEALQGMLPLPRLTCCRPADSASSAFVSVATS